MSSPNVNVKYMVENTICVYEFPFIYEFKLLGSFIRLFVRSFGLLEHWRCMLYGNGVSLHFFFIIQFVYAHFFSVALCLARHFTHTWASYARISIAVEHFAATNLPRHATLFNASILNYIHVGIFWICCTAYVSLVSILECIQLLYTRDNKKDRDICANP